MKKNISSWRCQWYQLPTYRWTRLGNRESSGGICPLRELLFMWLLHWGEGD